jgi:hypothetical protein
VTVTVEGQVSPTWYSRWVFFPKLIESCGSVSRQRVTVKDCFGRACELTRPVVGCEGDIETIPNVCTLTVATKDGVALVHWAQREYCGVMLAWESR